MVSERGKIDSEDVLDSVYRQLSLPNVNTSIGWNDSDEKRKNPSSHEAEMRIRIYNHNRRSSTATHPTLMSDVRPKDTTVFPSHPAEENLARMETIDISDPNFRQISWTQNGAQPTKINSQSSMVHARKVAAVEHSSIEAPEDTGARTPKVGVTLIERIESRARNDSIYRTIEAPIERDPMSMSEKIIEEDDQSVKNIKRFNTRSSANVQTRTQCLRNNTPTGEYYDAKSKKSVVSSLRSRRRSESESDQIAGTTGEDTAHTSHRVIVVAECGRNSMREDEKGKHNEKSFNRGDNRELCRNPSGILTLRDRERTKKTARGQVPIKEKCRQFLQPDHITMDGKSKHSNEENRCCILM